MTLQLLPMTKLDAWAWSRIRAAAYAGPTNLLLHTHLPVSESSFLGVTEDRKKEIGKPNHWQWKIVDTELPPSEDDPEANGGRTIAIAIWRAHNIDLDYEAKKRYGNMNEVLEKQTAEAIAAKTETTTPFVPPELRIDALNDLLAPFPVAQSEIMGTQPYLMLNTLATHPDHQRRGCGDILLKWGIQKADALGLLVCLNTSAAGKTLYEKHGFELKREYTWDREPWGGKGLDWYGFMVRKAREITEVST